MKILIIGAGDVGFQLAKRLCREHDITLIDSDPEKARRASEQLDAFVIEGHGSSYQVLNKANIHKCDIVAAMTNNDELNLIVCQMAKKAGVQTTIARVRNHEYTRPDFLIPREALGPDLIIHPEKETAEAILRLIRQSAATDLIELENGKIQIIGIRLERNSPMLRTPLKELGEDFNKLAMRIAAINRKEQTLIPRGDDILVAGDQLFIVCDGREIARILEMTGKRDTHIGTVMILGGGLIGQFVAQNTDSGVHVKIIESNKAKSQEIADLLPRSLIIHGDGTDIDLLAVEGITDMDAFIAVTGSDETNIIATLVARHLRVPRTIALVNNMEYMPITPTIGMDAVVSKQLITVNAVQRFIRHRQIAAFATIPGVDAQIIEYIASHRSKITRKPLKAINFPRNAIVGGIIHDDETIIPKGDTHVQAGDRVVVFLMPRAAKDVEKLFK
ncbi:MAG: Trk system potassium transporter TrkA [Calditrichaeota bacterium]|nr:Trk system potassium transporter TrkA [Calditrichota bacterium]MCB0305205.1 Trk system potassium transporter TrkA [Calditrichota bacterium]MCB9090592.1 Trk system potassium transporter TrkA [Calditrichia bacterium]